MKEFNLSIEQWQRLAATTPKERKMALGQLKRWVTYEIIRRKFSLEYGPFSCAAMGGYAVDVISEECLEALFCGEWHWKQTWKLSTMLINIAKSKMSLIVKEYHNHGKPELLSLNDSDEKRIAIEKEIAAQWKWEAEMRENGYNIARKEVAKYPELLAYLDAMFKDDSYIGIAEEMGTDIETTLKLEKKLLKLLAKQQAK